MRGWIFNGVYRKYEKESGKLRLSNGSWTINLKEVFGKMVHRVEYQTKKFTYSIDFKKAVDKGFRIMFKDEPKLVVPLIHWDKEAI